MRATKTALAISLSLLICLTFDRAGMLYAAMASITCMQHTAKESVRSGIERLFSTIVAALVALTVLNIAAYIPYYREFWFIVIIPIGALLTMYVAILLNWNSALPLAPIIYLVLTMELDITLRGYTIDVFLRVMGTIVGIFSAGLINRFIAPYKEESSK